MSKPVIAFVTGGYSGEAEISYKSAITIAANIDTEKFEYHKIDIRKDGWFAPQADGSEIDVDKGDFTITVDGRKVAFDAVLIGIHGTPGEDGKLQGYFDLLGIPYTSCDAATSAITFNKRYTVAVAAFAGIAVARSLHFFKGDSIDITQVSRELTYPVFVKPNNGGSSIGMSKVNREEDLQAALNKAFREDDQVLVEEFIAGREFTIGVCKIGNQIITLPFTEVIALNEFFDFEAKYQGRSTETTPAVVEEAVAEKVRSAAKKIYQVFNCNGVVRIDFIYNEEKGQPYMLEINTVPGQSAASIVPQQVKANGWTLKAFYSGLIEAALQKV
ncbi:MAG: D-alanine--D-alanine ligase [Chitinophagaceae bacterium]